MRDLEIVSLYTLQKRYSCDLYETFLFFIAIVSFRMQMIVWQSWQYFISKIHYIYLYFVLRSFDGSKQLGRSLRTVEVKLGHKVPQPIYSMVSFICHTWDLFEMWVQEQVAQALFR